MADCGIQNIRPGELVQSHKFSNYRFIQEDIADKKHLDALFEKQRFDLVVNLAAQAGVRYSISTWSWHRRKAWGPYPDVPTDRIL